MTGRRSARRATDREIAVVAAVLDAGSEKAAAYRLGLSHSTVKHHLARARAKVGARTTAELVWILGPRLPEPEGVAKATSSSVLEDGRDGRHVVTHCDTGASPTIDSDGALSGSI